MTSRWASRALVQALAVGLGAAPLAGQGGAVREAGLEEGIAIAREMLARVGASVQGIQVSAPFGRVGFALQVFDGVAGIDVAVAEPEISEGETLGFAPPWRGPDTEGERA